MKSMEFFILHRVVDSSTICSYQLTLGGISLLSLMGPKMLQSLNLNLQSYPDIYIGKSLSEALIFASNNP